jgi:hypothetical protein
MAKCYAGHNGTKPYNEKQKGDAYGLTTSKADTQINTKTVNVMWLTLFK